MSDIDDLIIQPENDSKIDKILNAPKSGKERLSEAWDAGYAGPIATTVAGAGAGYMAYNKISNTYEKNLADLVKAQKTEREAVNLLRTSKGEPVKDIRLVQAKPSTTSPIPDYSRKLKVKEYPIGAETRLSTVIPKTPIRTSNGVQYGGLSDLSYAQLQSEAKANTIDQLTRWLYPTTKTAKGEPLYIAQTKPMVQYKGVPNVNIPQYNPIELSVNVNPSIAPYARLANETPRSPFVLDRGNGTALTGVNVGKDIPLVPSSTIDTVKVPNPNYVKTPVPKTMVSSAEGLLQGNVVNPALERPFEASNISKFTKDIAESSYNGVKWVGGKAYKIFTHPITQKTFLVLDSTLTGLNAIGKYSEQSSKEGIGAGLYSGGAELSKIPLNYYTEYIPAGINLAVNTATDIITPKDFPSSNFDLLNPPYFNSGMIGLTNPYGENPSPKGPHPIMTGPEGQVYGP